MTTATDTLRAVIAAWRKQDVEGVLRQVHENITWNNSGGLRPPIQGKAEMRAALQRMAGEIGECRWRLFDVAEVNGRVWMEGVDEFFNKAGVRIPVPYAGVLEFQDGLIVKWREYFEGRLIDRALAGKGVSPQVEAMLDRPEV